MLLPRYEVRTTPHRVCEPARWPVRDRGSRHRSPKWGEQGADGFEIRQARLLLTGTKCACLALSMGINRSGRPAKEGTLNVENSWYALYTRSRHEKRVAETLAQRGFDTYLPTIPRVSVWHDRKKTVLWPLFPAYVFVRFRPADATKVLAIPGSVQVIGVAGRPAPIPDEEIENVRLFASCLAETGGEVPKSTPSIELGERVLVQSGPFAGIRGVVLEHRGVERVLIQIGLSVIGQSLKVELDAESLETSAVGDRERAL